MNKRAEVYFKDKRAGILERTDAGEYLFTYGGAYLDDPDARPVSATLPLTDKPYRSGTLFPFFHGLIAEGWLLELESKILKIDEHNAFELLLATGGDCVGAVSIKRIRAGEE